MAEISFTSKTMSNGNVMHTVKCIEPFFYEIEQGRKTWELRKDDREFEYKAGDSLCLYQIKDGLITGNWMVRKIIYVLRNADDFGLKPGYCIMTIK